mgnify:FL=1
MRRDMTGRSIATALFALLLASCSPVGGETQIAAEDYDQSCTSPDECAIVYDGSVCGCGQPAAVNRSVADEFRDDFDRMRTHCREVAYCQRSRVPKVYCTQGRCHAFHFDGGGSSDAGGDE